MLLDENSLASSSPQELKIPTQGQKTVQVQMAEASQVLSSQYIFWRDGDPIAPLQFSTCNDLYEHYFRLGYLNRYNDQSVLVDQRTKRTIPKTSEPLPKGLVHVYPLNTRGSIRRSWLPNDGRSECDALRFSQPDAILAAEDLRTILRLMELHDAFVETETNDAFERSGIAGQAGAFENFRPMSFSEWLHIFLSFENLTMELPSPRWLAERLAERDGHAMPMDKGKDPDDDQG